jgi:OmcA/MtrC family decaheme c-type cytochrome
MYSWGFKVSIQTHSITTKEQFMKHAEQSIHQRPSPHWAKYAAASILSVVLAACGGGGSDAPVVPVTPTPSLPTVTAPAGTLPVNVASLSPAQFAALTPSVTIGGVAINSPPVVVFAMSDGSAANNPIIGFNYTSKPATTNVTSLANMRFSLAKLVPGKDGNESKWVNYIVSSVSTYNADGTVKAAAAPRTPTTDQEGTLVDNKNGTYTYTFARDIKTIKDLVASSALTAPKVASDLGDLTFDPTLTHRLTIQISGNARGTGTNTADGTAAKAADGTAIAAIAMANPINVIYDFVPATGKAVAATDFQREVVSKTVCNECHEKLTLHGSRNETQYCVVCHTDQLKFGSTNVVSTNGKFPALTETVTTDATTGIKSYSYKPTMSVADGVTLGNFPVMVHKIHSGGDLVKENYNFANVVLDQKGFSILGSGQKMCAKCHDNTKAAQADNWNTKPSQLACGSCHDGIDWKTGTGSTIADGQAFNAAPAATNPVLAKTGHAPGQALSNQACTICHTPADIKVYHQTENITTHNPTIKAGLVTFTYDIKSAAVDPATNDLTVQFKISADGKPVTFVTAGATVASPLTGFTGAPSFLLAYTQAQDGIATPVDYNNVGVKQAQAISVSLADLLSTSKASTVGSLSATADGSGYYTAVIKGDAAGTKKFPVGATMRAVALQGYFTQVSPASARHAISVVKAVTGDTERRTVVDAKKCSNCHEWFEGHGGNRVYQTQVCVMCHTPGLATSGRGIADATLGAYTLFTAADNKILSGWGFDKSATNAALKLPVTTNNFKDMIHGIHSGRENATPFMDARDRTPSAITLLDFKRMDFPGKLNNCEACHVAGTFSSVPANALASTYESIDTAYAAAIGSGTATPALAKTALATANATDMVSSPFVAACASCHSSATAKTHFGLYKSAVVQQARSLFAATVASGSPDTSASVCASCHGVGKDKDVIAAHK